MTTSLTLDHNNLYQIFVFGPIGKPIHSRSGLWLAESFSICPLKLLNRIQQSSTKKQYINFLYQVCIYSGLFGTQDGCFGLWFAKTFSTFPMNPLYGIQRNFTGSNRSTSSSKFVFFRADWKNQDGCPVSDWLTQFQHLLWICYAEFKRNLTRSRTSASTKLGFPGRSENQDGRLIQSVNLSCRLYSGARYVALWVPC